MALDFTVKNTLHKITAKFAHVFLPGKKPCDLKAALPLQPELDIHGIACRADRYHIETDPQVIEEGFTAACELIYHLSMEGYHIKTPFFDIRVRTPGE
ncbi:MAG: hypothetical protein LBG57_14545 [Treponema sp.]|jgi:hypothetical protein|nr:hypothetical protein [Treponema sp.]